MLSKVITLSTLLLSLMACKPSQAVPTHQVIPFMIPTPPTTADPDTPFLPILLPNEANNWITYHDDLANFGLAIPQQWRITPPDPHAAQTSLTLANFDTALIDNKCEWPYGLVQLTFAAWQVNPEQPTLDWIGTQIVTVQSLESATNGRYPGYLLTINHHQALILRLTPHLILQIQITPQTAWQLPDVQNILNSLAAPEEAIELPATHPADPIATPSFCHDAAHLYSGPGTHFAEVGLLFANESLTIIGFSHDGRWLKLLYPQAPNHTAWVSLTESIATTGEPPIQPIQVRPGNS
jgi:hypothetical protein